MKSKVGFQRVKFFIKRNSYAFVVGVCMLLIVSSIAITAVVKLSQKTNEDNLLTEYTEYIEENIIPVNASEPIVFVTPVAEYTLGTGYAETSHVWNATLKEWSTHLGIDFVAVSGTAVLAAFDGTVENVTYTVLDGTMITIRHTDNLKTVYKSLSSEVEVTEGQTVTKGQIIGRVSDSASNEAEMGAHLHFEVFQDGKNVDPLEFLSITMK